MKDPFYVIAFFACLVSFTLGLCCAITVSVPKVILINHNFGEYNSQTGEFQLKTNVCNNPNHTNLVFLPIR